MSSSPGLPRLWLITPDLDPDTLLRATELALSVATPQRVGIQLRSLGLSRQARVEVGTALRRLTRRRGSRLFVNRDTELARAIDADGIQLPDGAPAPDDAALARGVSCHDAAGLRACLELRAEFALLSPVFPVPGKGAPMGVEGFADLVASSPVPTFALGGIGEGNATALLRAGAAGIAVIRSVYASPEPAEATQRLLQALELGSTAREA